MTPDETLQVLLQGINQLQNVAQQQQETIGALTAAVSELQGQGRMPQHPAIMADPSDLMLPPQSLQQEYPMGDYFVRIKPYNEVRGHLRRRQYFTELGRAIDGGSGKPGEIPTWVGPVNEALANRLAQYKQEPENPWSEPVLDIVTVQQKAQIDRAEAMQRMAMLGLSGVSPSAMGDHAKKVHPSTLMHKKPASMIPGSEQYLQGQQQRTLPVNIGGRAAALLNVPQGNPQIPMMPQAQQAAPMSIPMMPNVADMGMIPLPPPQVSDYNQEAVNEDLATDEAYSPDDELGQVMEQITPQVPASKRGRRRTMGAERSAE